MAVAPVQELRPTLDLTGLIREHVEAADDPDPHAIAEAVIADIPDELLREALQATLPDRVREFHRRTRKGHGGPSISARWREVGDNAAELAIFRRAVAVGPNDWRFLGSLTRDDVLRVVKERRDEAEAVNKQGDRYERLANLMQRHRAKVVQDLPAAQVAEVLDD